MLNLFINFVANSETLQERLRQGYETNNKVLHVVASDG